MRPDLPDGTPARLSRGHIGHLLPMQYGNRGSDTVLEIDNALLSPGNGTPPHQAKFASLTIGEEYGETFPVSPSADFFIAAAVGWPPPLQHRLGWIVPCSEGYALIEYAPYEWASFEQCPPDDRVSTEENGLPIVRGGTSLASFFDQKDGINETVFRFAFGESVGDTDNAESIKPFHSLYFIDSPGAIVRATESERIGEDASNIPGKYGFNFSYISPIPGRSIVAITAPGAPGKIIPIGGTGPGYRLRDDFADSRSLASLAAVESGAFVVAPDEAGFAQLSSSQDKAQGNHYRAYGSFIRSANLETFGDQISAALQPGGIDGQTDPTQAVHGVREWDTGKYELLLHPVFLWSDGQELQAAIENTLLSSTDPAPSLGSFERDLVIIPAKLAEDPLVIDPPEPEPAPDYAEFIFSPPSNAYTGGTLFYSLEYVSADESVIVSLLDTLSPYDIPPDFDAAIEDFLSDVNASDLWAERMPDANGDVVIRIGLGSVADPDPLADGDSFSLQLEIDDAGGDEELIFATVVISAPPYTPSSERWAMVADREADVAYVADVEDIVDFEDSPLNDWGSGSYYASLHTLENLPRGAWVAAIRYRCTATADQQSDAWGGLENEDFAGDLHTYRMNGCEAPPCPWAMPGGAVVVGSFSDYSSLIQQ